jgi:hypothetical protein
MSGGRVPRVLVVFLDAAETSLLESWSEEGLLRALAAFRHRARAFRPVNRLDFLPESLWPELATGRSVARTGSYSAMVRLRTGSSAIEPVPWRELDRGAYFWAWADRAGKRAVLLDMIEWPGRAPRRLAGPGLRRAQPFRPTP